MIVTGLAVFLFGTAVFAGPMIRPGQIPTEIVLTKHSSADKMAEYYPSTNGSPYIANYIQKGTNVFFKPQFVLSAAQMPPQIQPLIAAIEKDDCKTTLPMVPIQMLMEEPLRVVKEELIASSKPTVKEVIEINPIEHEQLVQIAPAVSRVLEMQVLPKMPIVVEESTLGLEIPCSPEEHVVIPEAPVLPPYVPHVQIPGPVVIEADKTNEIVAEIVIPPAPVLPELELPKLPIVIEEIQLTPVPVIPESVPFVEILPAPVLPPLEMPELPVLVEEPVVLDHQEEIVRVDIRPQDVPQVFGVPSLIPESYVREVVISPPEAPVLPPYIPIEVPQPVVIEENLVIPPVEIPAAPILPPFEMPKLSVIVEKTNEIPYLPSEIINKPTEIIEVEDKMVVIPEAPVLTPYIPEIVVEEKPIFIPQPPELSPFVTPKLRLTVVKEEEIISPVVHELPCEKIEIIEEVRPFISEAPVLAPYVPVNTPKLVIDEPVSIVMENRISEPVVIPAAPVLPPLEISELPIIIEEPRVLVSPNELHVSPVFTSEVTVSLPNSLIIEKEPIVLPEAPVLPPLSLPVLPVKVEVEEKVVPCDTVEIVEPLVIPEAPILSPFVPIEMPAPVLVEEPVTMEIQKPVVIPSAPVLPPLEMPIIIEETVEKVAPCPPEKELENPKIVTEFRPVVMPISYALPEHSLFNAFVSKPIVLTPEFLVPNFPLVAEKLIKEPAACVHDLVVERILPTMEKSRELIGAQVPVSEYLPPLRYAFLRGK